MQIGSTSGAHRPPRLLTATTGLAQGRVNPGEKSAATQAIGRDVAGGSGNVVHWLIHSVLDVLDDLQVEPGGNN